MSGTRRDPSSISVNYLRGLKKQAAVGGLLTAASFLTPRIHLRKGRKPRRIGVFCQWGVGDAVLLLPLLRSLRMAFPDASLELIGKPWLDDLFKNEGCCDQTHILVPPWTAYSRKYRPTFKEVKSYLSQVGHLRKRNFDLLISARFDPREILQMRLLRARATYGFRAAGGRYWITDDLGVDRTTHDAMHRAQLAIEVGGTIAAAVDETQAFFRAKARATGWLAEQGYRGGGVLAVHTGAGHPIRRWPDTHFDTILRGLSIKPGLVVFIEDPESAATSWNGPLPHIHWRGNLASLKTVLLNCDIFLGTDSGIMHMASAAGCEVVAIFGPGEPRWFGPFGTGHEIVYKAVMPCRPCFDKCIYRSPICMQNINAREIIEAVDDRLKKFEVQA